MLGVPVWLIERHGAVSEDVARAMVGGALTHSQATLGISITGIAGPDGGTEEKPVGLVHFAAGRRDTEITHERVMFGDLGRTNVQREAVAYALAHPEEAARSVARRSPALGYEMALAHWRESMKAIDTPFVRERGYGAATPERLQRSIDLVRQAFTLQAALTPKDVYADGFMP